MSNQAGRGLILDWGGVLTTPVDDAFAAFLGIEDIDPEVFRQAMRTMHDEPGSPLHRVELGESTREEFEQALADRLRTRDGQAVPAADLVQRMFAASRPNGAMRDLVAAARKRGWCTALLSNSWGNVYDDAVLATLFDAVLLSADIGVRKPQAAAYLMAAERLGLEPRQCVFVDDLRRNATAANEIGMIGFQYQAGSESDLENVLRQQEES